MSRTVGAAAIAAKALSTTSHIDPKGLFVNSDLSERYMKYRPKLPTQHVETIVNDLLGGKRPGLWLDVGCGPGNSTQQIAGYSDKIIGVDISETQIEVANRINEDSSISFVQGGCEALPAEDSSVDVITAVQAAHYFDLPAFFKEAERVLRPGGVIALIYICAPRCSSSQNIDRAYDVIVETFTEYGLPDKLQLIWDHYKDVDLPFGNRQDFKMDCRNDWTLSEFMNLLMTYSNVQNMVEEKGLSKEEGWDYLWKRYLEYGITEEEQTEVQEFTRVIGMAADVKN